MRVSLKTRAQDGLIPSSKRFYVDCTVLFSEEEKAIIRARGLSRHYLELESAFVPPAHWHQPFAKFLKVSAFLLFLGGCTAGIGMTMAGNPHGGDATTGLSFFAALAMFLAGVALNRQVHVAQQPIQRISIGQLMSNPVFSVYAMDNASAKLMDLEVRAALERLKNGLLANAAVNEPDTFEL